MVQLYGALAANKLLFNSAYNRDSFLAGVEKLLIKFPDEIPDSVVDTLRNKSDVLPVVISPVKEKETKNKVLKVMKKLDAFCFIFALKTWSYGPGVLFRLFYQ